ncbi:hypothetical protein SKAU_G00093650 [Synaphobranchus kaupii]|uniref:Uncharacterized protein n=1 Tax=Synaphobranchus kaupii TaxID=118154 RepID=A0A9Q1FXQ4_SYNKA|nr:hypothetical protein SKAU_G00093650 [Synaphobranchus kaupii]
MHTHYSVLELQDEYWKVMEEITPVLSTLKCATTVMSTEQNVSISNVYPVTFSLLQKHLMREEAESTRVSEFKSQVRASLGERMKLLLEMETERLRAREIRYAQMRMPRRTRCICCSEITTSLLKKLGQQMKWIAT